MLNPLARSQERQNINLLRSNEKTNSLQDNLVRDFFKRRQTNRSPIVARSLLKSPKSSSNSETDFLYSEPPEIILQSKKRKNNNIFKF